jgi:hypothetical protein
MYKIALFPNIKSFSGKYFKKYKITVNKYKIIAFHYKNKYDKMKQLQKCKNISIYTHIKETQYPLCLYITIFPFSRIENSVVDLGAYENQSILKSANNVAQLQEDEVTEEQQSNNELNLSVYPNPLQQGQQLTVELTSMYSSYDETVIIRMYNTMGGVVYSATHGGGYVQIDLPAVASGMYVLTVQTEDGKRYTKKIMVK